MPAKVATKKNARLRSSISQGSARRYLISDALPFGSHFSVKLLGMAIYNMMGAVMALGILTSCTSQTTGPTRVSEVKDRHNFRDEQEGAPRVDTAPINP